jgi:hypothetical protein
MQPDIHPLTHARRRLQATLEDHGFSDCQMPDLDINGLVGEDRSTSDLKEFVEGYSLPVSAAHIVRYCNAASSKHDLKSNVGCFTVNVCLPTVDVPENHRQIQQLTACALRDPSMAFARSVLSSLAEGIGLSIGVRGARIRPIYAAVLQPAISLDFECAHLRGEPSCLLCKGRGWVGVAIGGLLRQNSEVALSTITPLAIAVNIDRVAAIVGKVPNFDALYELG